VSNPKNRSASRDRRSAPATKLRRWLAHRGGGGSSGTLDAEARRNWSYETLSREVCANLVDREFTRMGGERRKMKKAYLQLLEIASRVTGQAQKFSREIAARVKRGNLTVLHKAKTQADEMVPRVQRVLRQARRISPMSAANSS
jgi:hypothetical protein